MQNAANGASTTLMWVGRAAWSLVGLAAPWAVLGEGRSGAVGVAANVWGWGAWLAVLVALFVPSALSLTAVRIIVPAVAVAGLWSAEPASVGTALFALVVLSSRDVADVLVQGSAYGAETRFVLRTPVPYLVPAVLVWAALVCATVGGTLLLAAGNLVAGIPVAAAGAVLAWRVPLRLHRLSRRWLVAVPAGLVVHDHLVLAETFMVRRNHLGPVTLARAAGGRGGPHRGGARPAGDRVDDAAGQGGAVPHHHAHPRHVAGAPCGLVRGGALACRRRSRGCQRGSVTIPPPRTNVSVGS